MTPPEAMEKIEGHRFSALANLASEFGTFLRILADQPEVKTLLEAMKTEPGRTPEVLRRLLELADSSVEEDSEHPADVAMATYLWLLSLKDSEMSEIGAEAILECKQCWWSRKMAERVRKATRFHSQASLVSSTLPAGTLAVDFTAHDRAGVVTVSTWAQIAGRGVRAVPTGGAVVLYPVEAAKVSDLLRNSEARTSKEALVRVLT
jgi:hypothetical protein